MKWTNGTKEIEFLGNVSWNCERSLKVLENDFKNTIVARQPLDSNLDDNIQPLKLKFPMETAESIQKFETDLSDEKHDMEVFSYELLACKTSRKVFVL